MSPQLKLFIDGVEVRKGDKLMRGQTVITFDHLLLEQGVKWDGHTNDEKWDRVSKFIAQDEWQKIPETKTASYFGVSNMTLLDVFAKEAMGSMLADEGWESIPKSAYDMAEKMLAEREKREKRK